MHFLSSELHYYNRFNHTYINIIANKGTIPRFIKFFILGPIFKKLCNVTQYIKLDVDPRWDDDASPMLY